LTYSENASADKLTIYAGDIRFVPSDNEGRNFGQISVLSSCAAPARVSQGSLEIGSTKEKFVAWSGQSHLATAEIGVEYKNTEGMRDDEALPNIVTPEVHHNYLHVACSGKPPVEFGSGTKNQGRGRGRRYDGDADRSSGESGSAVKQPRERRLCDSPNKLPPRNSASP
jgi:hypothetical protein